MAKFTLVLLLSVTVSLFDFHCKSVALALTRPSMMISTRKQSLQLATVSMLSLQKNPHDMEREGEHGLEDINEPLVSRRDVGSRIFGGAFFALSANIIKNPSASAADPPGSAFVGTYSDPINHPGGKRTIRLLDKVVGDYQLAEVEGGGGIGEPKSYVLPAVLVGDRAIIIDFTPKGGPRDFTGVLDGKNIKFLRDGNKWPRID
uniref:Photosystem II 10 kDa polypeptide, chloroplastic n=1 Tax=Proboscia inermis TaxID=420281 RepID=A0A7S0C8P0_9STRA|mmetsp:Transcript_34490/g.34686  ORF Transcript_34490/g.34686 Transcript_34490/m.34686 type:complete len:204 (+) Transcript_34490:147-758(+)